MKATELFKLFTRPKRTPFTEADESVLALATEHQLIADGHRLTGWVWGKRGPRVLLVHGWESKAAQMGAFVLPLTQAGMQVIAFDGPAHGLSDGDSSSVIHFGRALAAIGREIASLDAVVAHSVGSPATLYAMRAGLRLKTSVHIAGPASFERVLHWAAQMAELPPAEFGEFRMLVEQFTGEAVSTMELEHLSMALSRPGLIMHDPQDRQVPFAESTALHGAWPISTLLPIPGAGHKRMLEHPAVVKAVVDHMVKTLHVSADRVQGAA
ncbi:MAG: alpha/beta hydrolase [Pseudomonadota bacterium]